MKQILLMIAVVALVALVGCGEEEPAELRGHTCYYCQSEVPIAARACRFCTRDPYGPLKTAEDLVRREFEMKGENERNAAILKDKLKPKERTGWHDAVGVAYVLFSIAFVSIGFEDIKAKRYGGCFGTIFWFVIGTLIANWLGAFT